MPTRCANRYIHVLENSYDFMMSNIHCSNVHCSIVQCDIANKKTEHSNANQRK